MNVLLVDDQPLVLEALRSRLSRCQELTVVGTAGGGEEALREVERLKPDLVLMDLRMPGLDGLGAIRRLKQDHPSIPVIALTVSESEESLLEAIVAGAAGYLTKDSSLDLLLEAIRAVGEGASILPGELLRQSLRKVAVRTATLRQALLKEPLSEREFEVLELLARGYPNKAISEALNIVEATVKKHVHNIIRKLEVSDRTQAVVTSIRMGLVKP